MSKKIQLTSVETIQSTTLKLIARRAPNMSTMAKNATATTDPSDEVEYDLSPLLLVHMSGRRGSIVDVEKIQLTSVEKIQLASVKKFS